MKIVYRLHAIERMFERNISEENINEAVLIGKVIENYPEDKPYPSKLLFALINNRPIHVVIAENISNEEIIVITVYEPDLSKWDESFERRKMK